jgi:alpha-glucosidase
MSTESLGYSLFLDQIYKQRWDFTSQSAWKVQTEGSQIRGFITVAEDLPTLRRAFMDLVGHPLVPPKKAFGLWVSQYGFDSWTEIEDKLRTLREHHFPIDGFVMDLQWFGGVKKNSENTRMGTLEFDTSSEHFPDPAAKIKSFWHDQGIGLITIEESYIGKGLKEFDDLAQRGFLVKATPTSDPLYINENPWWGLGGMIDWSNPAAGAYWAQTKRKNLIDLGIVGHWTDLGEPEMYRHVDLIGGKKVYTVPSNEAETHNLFSLDWHESIFKGYQAMGSLRRPFILSRSGGPGMQKYGAAMWSGDIGSKFEDLATHYNVQMHMSLSGQDYFGADVGGFHREDLDGDLNELYTQWFADACAFDVPVRPHTEDLDKTHNTAPDRIGDMASNLASVRERYELSPYYYSLAHLAYTNAEPVVPPVFFYYPSNQDRTLGSEKLIGRNLLVALVARSGEKARNVYLPPGDWFDYRNLDWYPGGDQTINAYPVYRDGHFELPIFARAGAIIPKMLVDDQTMNILGKRLDGVTHTELVARVFSSQTPTQFTVSEDDGTTTAYQQGALAQTEISQHRSGDHAFVEVAPTLGKYSYEDPNSGLTMQSPSIRQFVVELVVPKISDKNSLQVSLNGERLRRFDNERDYAASQSGYFVQSDHLVVAKSASLSIEQKKIFDFDLSVKGGVR